jgi:hypothetical protein
MLAAFARWLCHVTGCDYGLPYGHFAWYNLYSGFGGSVPDVMIPATCLAWWYHHTCHDSWKCLHWGRYPAAGGMFRLCRQHHPDLMGQRPHRELIRQLHREHTARMAS